MRQLRNFGSGEPAKPNADKYEGMSESELMRELYKNVAKAKSDGTFSAVQLDEFVKFVSPTLDERSRSRLNELVELIKNGV